MSKHVFSVQLFPIQLIALLTFNCLASRCNWSFEIWDLLICFSCNSCAAALNLNFCSENINNYYWIFDIIVFDCHQSHHYVSTNKICLIIRMKLCALRLKVFRWPWCRVSSDFGFRICWIGKRFYFQWTKQNLLVWCQVQNTVIWQLFDGNV